MNIPRNFVELDLLGGSKECVHLFHVAKDHYFLT